MKKILILWLLISTAFFSFGQIPTDHISKKKKTVETASNTASYDASYQAVLTRATALGYTLPSTSQRTKQNNFVLALKAADIWNSLDVLYVFATDGNSDFATLNWKDPNNFQCSKVNSPVFTTNQGFNGDGATSYLNTNWVPSTNGVSYTLNESGYFAWVNVNTVNTNMVDLGCQATAGSGRIVLTSRDASDRMLYAVNSSLQPTTAGTVTNGLGLWHSYRTSSLSTANFVYYNGVLLDNTGTVSLNVPDRNLLILANIQPAGTIVNFSSRQVSVVGLGASLVGKELSLYNAWNTYFTSL